MTQIGRLGPFTLWHVDPNKGGDDDSCGWFCRARHGDPETLKRIAREFECEWDRTFQISEEDAAEDAEEYGTTPDRTIHQRGLFHSVTGAPVLSAHGITLSLFYLAARYRFGAWEKSPWGKPHFMPSWEKGRRFMQRHLFEILEFAENTRDSLNDKIAQVFKQDRNAAQTKREREERIEEFAAIIYGWILRADRPWWKHPRWHVHHWKITTGWLYKLGRWWRGEKEQRGMMEAKRGT